ncbi:hypothetical protein AeMF1_020839, partial [Aphanomyces euteiches]
MQSFLGSINSRFIENYSIKASCLYEISDVQLRQGSVSSAALVAFDELKRAYASTPVHKHANPNLPCPPSDSTMDDLTLYTPLKSTRSLTPVQQSLPRFTAEESAVIATFDGSIKFSERVGGFGAILWQLPEWTILWAGYGVVTDTTVNGAEYAGLLAVLSAAIRLHLTGVRVFGDSRLVIQQTLLAEVHTLNHQLANPSFHHVKRVWNGAADHLASQGLTDRTT